eukprot:2997716-Amphidinium_carterae.1
MADEKPVVVNKCSEGAHSSIDRGLVIALAILMESGEKVPLKSSLASCCTLSFEPKFSEIGQSDGKWMECDQPMADMIRSNKW